MQRKDNAKKITILFIEHRGTMVGGGQFSVVSLLGRLREMGCRVEVAIPCRGEYYDVLQERGFSPYIADVNSFGGGNIFRLPVAVVKMRQLIKSTGADIVHANSARAALVGGLACLGTGCAMLWHLRIPGREPLYDLLLTRLSRRIIAISHHVAGRIRHDRHKVRIIYNGVEKAPEQPKEKLQALREHYRLGDAPVIGTVCQLVPSKGLENFIYVGNTILRTLPNVRFLIIGRESPTMAPGYVDKLRALCKRLNVADKFIFTGFQKDIYAYYALMDVFTFYTELEAFGRVVAEAMMAGKPVVSSSVGGIPEIIVDGENGFLFPLHRDDLAAEKILYLLTCRAVAKNMGLKGKDRAEKMFTADINAEEIEAIYKELVIR